MAEAEARTKWRSRTLEQGEAWGLDYIVLGLAMGHRCGYVRVPEDHPWFGLDCCDAADGGKQPLKAFTEGSKIEVPDRDDEAYIEYDEQIGAKLRVHGGITYAGKQPGKDCAEGWWFGFDCAHLNDARDPDLMSSRYQEIVGDYPDDPESTIRSTEYVAYECKHLAAQLQAAAALAR